MVDYEKQVRLIHIDHVNLFIYDYVFLNENGKPCFCKIVDNRCRVKKDINKIMNNLRDTSILEQCLFDFGYKLVKVREYSHYILYNVDKCGSKVKKMDF